MDANSDTQKKLVSLLIQALSVNPTSRPKCGEIADAAEEALRQQPGATVSSTTPTRARDGLTMTLHSDPMTLPSSSPVSGSPITAVDLSKIHNKISNIIGYNGQKSHTSYHPSGTARSRSSAAASSAATSSQRHAAFGESTTISGSTTPTTTAASVLSANCNENAYGGNSKVAARMLKSASFDSMPTLPGVALVSDAASTNSSKAAMISLHPNNTNARTSNASNNGISTGNQNHLLMSSSRLSSSRATDVFNRSRSALSMRRCPHSRETLSLRTGGTTITTTATTTTTNSLNNGAVLLRAPANTITAACVTSPTTVRLPSSKPSSPYRPVVTSPTTTTTTTTIIRSRPSSTHRMVTTTTTTTSTANNATAPTYTTSASASPTFGTVTTAPGTTNSSFVTNTNNHTFAGSSVVSTPAGAALTSPSSINTSTITLQAAREPMTTTTVTYQSLTSPIDTHHMAARTITAASATSHSSGSVGSDNTASSSSNARRQPRSEAERKQLLEAAKRATQTSRMLCSNTTQHVQKGSVLSTMSPGGSERQPSKTTTGTSTTTTTITSPSAFNTGTSSSGGTFLNLLAEDNTSGSTGRSRVGVTQMNPLPSGTLVTTYHVGSSSMPGSKAATNVTTASLAAAPPAHQPGSSSTKSSHSASRIPSTSPYRGSQTSQEDTPGSLSFSIGEQGSQQRAPPPAPIYQLQQHILSSMTPTAVDLKDMDGRTRVSGTTTGGSTTTTTVMSTNQNVLTPQRKQQDVTVEF